MSKLSQFSLFLSAIIIGLSGCSSYNRLEPSPPEIFHSSEGQVRSTTGGGIGRLLAFNKNSKANLIADLKRRDIQLVRYGDTYTLIIPCDKYYLINSAQLNDLSYAGLIDVVKLLALFPNTPIYVASFTDNIGSVEHKTKLTQSRAETLITFLWSNNISAKRLHPEGYADKFSIGDNKRIHGSAYNRRIEIQWLANRVASEAQVAPFASWKK